MLGIKIQTVTLKNMLTAALLRAKPYLGAPLMGCAGQDTDPQTI